MNDRQGACTLSVFNEVYNKLLGNSLRNFAHSLRSLRLNFSTTRIREIHKVVTLLNGTLNKFVPSVGFFRFFVEDVVLELIVGGMIT